MDRKRMERLIAENAAMMAAPRSTAPAATSGPRPEDGRTTDRASGRDFMLVKNIEPDPDQPRKQFDAELIQRIGASLNANGQLQPLIVWWCADLGKWVIEDGEQRYIAAKAAGIDRLWCMFTQKSYTPDERFKRQLMSACLRADLMEIERANAFKRLIDLTGCTQQQLARDLHLNQSTVSRTLALLELPPAIQANITAGKISPSAGVALREIGYSDPVERDELAAKVVAGDATRDDVLKVAKRKKAKRQGKPRPLKAATFRTFAGVVVVTPKRCNETDPVAAALREALDQHDEQKRRAAA